jgi:hypothetical protein
VQPPAPVDITLGVAPPQSPQPGWHREPDLVAAGLPGAAPGAITKLVGAKAAEAADSRAATTPLTSCFGQEELLTWTNSCFPPRRKMICIGRSSRLRAGVAFFGKIPETPPRGETGRLPSNYGVEMPTTVMR